MKHWSTNLMYVLGEESDYPNVADAHYYPRDLSSPIDKDMESIEPQQGTGRLDGWIAPVHLSCWTKVTPTTTTISALLSAW